MPRAYPRSARLGRARTIHLLAKRSALPSAHDSYPAAVLLDSIEWLGHSGFRIRTPGGLVYIDPYRVGDVPKADLILITHGHYDHFSPRDVEQLSHRDTWLVGPAAVAERVSGQVLSIAPGEAGGRGLLRGRGRRASCCAGWAWRPSRPTTPPSATRTATCFIRGMRDGWDST